jgi:RNA processing factor Prp31
MKKNTRVKLASNDHKDYLDIVYIMDQDYENLSDMLDEMVEFIQRQERHCEQLDQYDDRQGAMVIGNGFQHLGAPGLDIIDDAVDSLHEIQDELRDYIDQVKDNVKPIEKYLDDNWENK